MSPEKQQRFYLILIMVLVAFGVGAISKGGKKAEFPA